jgi:hypothetical protein
MLFLLLLSLLGSTSQFPALQDLAVPTVTHEDISGGQYLNYKSISVGQYLNLKMYRQEIPALEKISGGLAVLYSRCQWAVPIIEDVSGVQYLYLKMYKVGSTYI